MNFTNPTTYKQWLQPHSIAWYTQLSKLQKNYTYAWQSTVPEPNGETIFDEEVMTSIVGKSALDIGCGDGSFTNKCGQAAKEIVGFDVTENYIEAGLNNPKTNISFIQGDIKQGLPFKDHTFDLAFIRKGPTSAYPIVKNVVKSGGKIFGLHPGDDTYKELGALFPNLFDAPLGTPILQLITRRMEEGQFSQVSIEIINTLEYLHSPLDVLKLRCFGQHPAILEALMHTDLHKVTRIFECYACEDGLPVTFSRYIVRAEL